MVKCGSSIDLVDLLWWNENNVLVSIRCDKSLFRSFWDNFVVIYDSRDGFQNTLGSMDQFKRVMVVHSPSAEVENSDKADGVKEFIMVPPSRHELQIFDSILLPESRLGTRFERMFDLIGPSVRYLYRSEVVVIEKIENAVMILVDVECSPWIS